MDCDVRGEEVGHFPNRSRPFRIGVWCYYGATLKPTAGIGVFVYNLIAGLFQLPEPVEVVMLVAPGGHEAGSWLKLLARGRLRMLAEQTTWWERLDVWMEWLWWKMRLLRHWFFLFSWRSRNILNYFRGPFMDRALAGNPALILLATICLPAFFQVFWILFIVYQMTAAGVRLLQRFLGIFSSLLPPWNRRFQVRNKSLALAREADCDVWIIPYVGFDYPLPVPSVLFIHDLVTSHFPEMFAKDFVRHIERVAPARAAEATLCGCMSAFIRDTDLLGVLGLPPAKVRMVPFAPPSDFPAMSEERARGLKPALLKRPYLFFPAGLRGHKNHYMLILALRHFSDVHGEADLELVLTGEAAGMLPAALDRVVNDTGLSHRVHVLGPVDRETLAALYQGAFATIIPTLYEQGSFPIYEAIHWGCPVACSDIKPLRDQCAPMGDAMMYFDPLDPQDIARAILDIRADREKIRSRQQQASRVLWERTWTDVAREWLVVFQEAAEIHRNGLRANLRGPAFSQLKRSA